MPNDQFTGKPASLDPFKVVETLATLTEAVRALQKQTAQFEQDSDRKREKLHERIHLLSNMMTPVPAKLEDVTERVVKMAGVMEQLTMLSRDHTALFAEHAKIISSLGTKINNLEDKVEAKEKEDDSKKWFGRGALFAIGVTGGALGDNILKFLQKLGNTIDPPLPPGH
jgi:uncharacterized protein YoxC